MRVYSDLTKQFYDTVDECTKAEDDFKAEQEKKQSLADVKKQRANEIIEAKKELNEVIQKANEIRLKAIQEANNTYSNSIKEAEDKYEDLKSKFIEDYGSFHYSYTNINGKEDFKISDVLDAFTDIFRLL